MDLNVKEAAALAGIGESTLRAKVREGEFPKPVQVPWRGRYKNMWYRADVLAWKSAPVIRATVEDFDAAWDVTPSPQSVWSEWWPYAVMALGLFFVLMFVK